MTPEGDIRVRLACADGRVHRVDVASSRTGLPPRLVQGRTPADAGRLVPLLFSVCRRAQGAVVTFSIVTALVFLLILDLDRPRRGLIRVGHASMRELKERLIATP